MRFSSGSIVISNLFMLGSRCLLSVVQFDRNERHVWKCEIKVNDFVRDSLTIKRYISTQKI